MYQITHSSPLQSSESVFIGKFRRLISIVFWLSFASAFAAHADDLGATDNGLTILANAFTTSFWPKLSLNNTDLLKFLNNVVGSTIRFYGGTISRDRFFAIQSAYLDRWPQRTYTLEPNTLSIFCDAETSICKVSGIVSWDVSSAARNARSTGRANFDFLLSCRQPSPTYSCLMTEESGSVISRTSSKLTP